ncbi:MAG TPA: aminoglycoside phosphotransferase family protein [Pyrinomonadaceae bacterium]|nr:aminoglycoside phosphotransferase family protein [Pyrinomonadaceae bacterium]
MKDRLPAKAAEWNVTLEETRETATSVLGFGVRDGRRVVLKLTKKADDEMHSGAVLRAFGGVGAVRVLEAEIGAVLLERLDPGEDLVSLVRRGADDEATTILAQVIASLANHAAPAECQTVTDWGRGFARYVHSGDAQIPYGLVKQAQAVYEHLTSSQGAPTLLHGDLQHYNVLFDRQRGWTAIDPKGVVGELEYEVGALLRNPVELPELFTNPATIERRLKILTTLLPLDHTRVIRWAFAQAVLSAIWSIEDGEAIDSNHPVLQLARALRPMFEN